MEAAKPLVSVCMITYNHEKFIAEAIDGVLMQKTDFPIELIIGEDCSTDNTRQICIEYKDKYPQIIRLILPEKNLGMMPNFTNTLQACTGKYIALCEGDDYWTDPYKLQKQVDFMEAEEDISMCFHNTKILKYGQWGDKGIYRGINNNYFDSNMFFKKWCIPTATMLFRGKYLVNYSDPRIFLGDHFIFLLMADKGLVYGMSDCMSVYRIHENGFSSTIYRDVLIFTSQYVSFLQFIRETFPKVSKKLISIQICTCYLQLFKEEIKINKRIKPNYLFASFWESPIVFMKTIFKYNILPKVRLLCKIFSQKSSS
jgi:glycosyltransferase involved in cell wall biosynthesis